MRPEQWVGCGSWDLGEQRNGGECQQVCSGVGEYARPRGLVQVGEAGEAEPDITGPWMPGLLAYTGQQEMVALSLYNSPGSSWPTQGGPEVARHSKPCTPTAPNRPSALAGGPAHHTHSKPISPFSTFKLLL